MFTGIITDIGTIKALEKRGQDVYLQIATSYDMKTVAMGASIACDGVCLTVVEKGDGWYGVDVSAETLRCTTLASWQLGQKVNLERALKVGDELGGHIVSGHVDGVAEVASIENTGDCYKITFNAPNDLKAYIAAKGSVALNGVSLTVNRVGDRDFTVNIIPHTWAHTNFHELKAGDTVNLEIDVVARYMARQLSVANS